MRGGRWRWGDAVPRERKRAGHRESDTQIACVAWFRQEYRGYERLLFSVPNGGYRRRVTAQVMKAEGMVAGVADLILLLPRHGYHFLAIEMKSREGRQSAAQKAWQADAERAGGMYVICRSVEEFQCVISRYFNDGRG